MRKLYPNGSDAMKIKQAVAAAKKDGKEADSAALAQKLNVDEKAVKKHIASLTKGKAAPAKTDGKTA